MSTTFASFFGKGAVATPDILKVAASAIIAVVIFVSILGPGWLFVPPNVPASTSALTLNFADLHDLANSGLVPTSVVQQAYFGWLGWTLAVVTSVAAFVVAVWSRRTSCLILAALSAAGLVLTTFGVKGALTWSDLADQAPNVRAGGYLIFFGYAAALAFAVLLAGRKSRTAD